MIVGFEVHRLGAPHPDGPLHEVCLVVVVDGSTGVFHLVELDEGKASLFFGDMINGDLNGLDLSEGVEEGKNLLLVHALRQVADIDGPLEVFLLLHLF